jgi:hypothetical protein
MTWRILIGALMGLALVGCGGSSNPPAPADFAGNYTVAVTNGQNGCGFTNWTVGSSSNGTPVTITQNATSASADVGGASGIYYDLILGSHVFQGSVSGTQMSMSIHGTRTAHKGNCAYQVTAVMGGSLSGDSISGTISYSTTTNGGTDCGTLASCASTQSFAGARPPK